MTAPVEFLWTNRHTLRVIGEVDLSNARLLEREASKRAGEPLVVDLTELEFMDSTGLGALVNARKRSKLTLRMTHGSKVKRLLEIAGLSDHFSVEWVETPA